MKLTELHPTTIKPPEVYPMNYSALDFFFKIFLRAFPKHWIDSWRLQPRSGTKLIHILRQVFFLNLINKNMIWKFNKRDIRLNILKNKIIFFGYIFDFPNSLHINYKIARSTLIQWIKIKCEKGYYLTYKRRYMKNALCNDKL